jgi:hypothetical protein
LIHGRFTESSFARLEKTMVKKSNSFCFLLGNHAALRSAQRDIPTKEISSVLFYGDWHLEKRQRRYWEPAPEPGERRKVSRYVVTLSRHHIPPEERACLRRHAGGIVVLEEFSDIVTVMKKRSCESSLPQPYIREQTRWQEYLRRDMMDM